MKNTDSEYLTRKQKIDPLLCECGWQIAKYDKLRALTDYGDCAIEEYPTVNGIADYALCLDGEIMGIIEAKKPDSGSAEVLTQAQRYSRGLTNSPKYYGDYSAPFLYATNGETIWFEDVGYRYSRSRKVARFHTPNALREMLRRNFDDECLWFSKNQNNHPFLRPYQIDANNEIEKSITRYRREMLVAMATGTGKTFTMVNQVYRLMSSGVARRILFLVDRRSLAAQAVQAFASFEPEYGKKFDKLYEVYNQKFKRNDLDENAKFDSKILPHSYLVNPKYGDAFVYVSTIQRMSQNLFGRDNAITSNDEPYDDDVERLDIPIHTFDLIIADECHRGYTTAEQSVWRKTLDYFDAIRIGLTATPAAHTKAYFKDVVFRYDYKRAVREGYLVDYDLLKIDSKVRIKGVFLKEGEQVGVIDTSTGVEKLDEVEDERAFESTEIEATITVPDSNRKILEEIKGYCEEHEKEYGRFPKTLIFAANDLPHTSHSDILVDMARDVFGRGDSFVRKITSKVDEPLTRIREFRNRPEPGVVVSVDMLTTGVDIPDLEFIVFLRPVKSRILFEQMLGRGTRKGEHYPNKSHFTVIDCFNGTLMEYFKGATTITVAPPDRPHKKITEVIDDVWSNRDRDYNINCLVKQLRRIEKEMSGEAREKFANFISNGDIGKYAGELTDNLLNNFTETMELLRKGEFQKLLIDYPRQPRNFWVAYDAEDEVTSEFLVKGEDGKEYKPEDYLIAFGRFVRENPAQVDAIGILLNRPHDWGTEALKELNQKLSKAPERFTLDNLRKVHRKKYNIELADIISMLKHAADDTSPLLTAEQRVNIALDKVTAGKIFTVAQQQWLDRIREYLIENLSVDLNDFDDIPIFNRYGGRSKANKDFNNMLEDILKQINEAIAA